jgi:hypothetical protein
MKPPFEAWDITKVACSLGDATERHHERCAAEAKALDAALVGTARVPPVSRYADSPDRVRHRVRFADAFATWKDFVSAVRGGEDPGALELALSLVAKVAPGEVLPIARAILEVKPWREMGNRVGGALAQVDDPAAIDLALAHAEKPYVMSGVSGSLCARAWPKVMARLEASPVMDTTRTHPRSESYLAEYLIAYFGKNRTEEAWPLLARLYEDSVDKYVVLATGHALVSYDDDRSLALLRGSLGSRGEHHRFFAVKAHLRKGDARAVDALGGLDALRSPSGKAVARELMEQVWNAARDAKRPIEDARYLELALGWVKDRTMKGVSQYVLDLFGKRAVAAAKKRLEKAGKLTKPVRLPQPKRADILAMRRALVAARKNLERIVAELRALGYAFDAKVPLGKPAPMKTVRAIEKAVGGPLPLSLRTAFTVIGACDLTGSFPGHPRSLESDAFVLVDAREALEEALEMGGGEAQVSLALAPDAVAKAGFSGGREEMLVPDASLDAPIVGVPGEPLLLGRLREVFGYGGFPGLKAAKGELGAIVQRLAKVCEEI